MLVQELYEAPPGGTCLVLPDDNVVRECLRRDDEQGRAGRASGQTLFRHLHEDGVLLVLVQELELLVRIEIGLADQHVQAAFGDLLVAAADDGGRDHGTDEHQQEPRH